MDFENIIHISIYYKKNNGSFKDFKFKLQKTFSLPFVPSKNDFIKFNVNYRPREIENICYDLSGSVNIYVTPYYVATKKHLFDLLSQFKTIGFDSVEVKDKVLFLYVNNIEPNTMPVAIDDNEITNFIDLFD